MLDVVFLLCSYKTYCGFISEIVMCSMLLFVYTVLQKLKRPDPTVGRQSGRLQHHLQRKAIKEERAQTQDRPPGR